MPSHEGLQLAVDVPAPGVVVIRAVGDLDRASAPRLVRLLDQYLLTLRSRPAAHLVVDLSGIRTFGNGGIEIVLGTRCLAERTDVRMCLTGLVDRRDLLPRRVAGLLGDLDGFPSVEHALCAIPDE